MTKPDTEPVTPFLWVKDTPVKLRGVETDIVWRVESQTGSLVRITRDTPSGRITRHEDWSRLIQWIAEETR